MGNAGNGLWIGPKTWDRNCRNSLETLGAVRDSPENSVGVVWFNLCIKWLFGMYWAGNGRGFRVL